MASIANISMAIIRRHHGGSHRGSSDQRQRLMAAAKSSNNVNCNIAMKTGKIEKQHIKASMAAASA